MADKQLAYDARRNTDLFDDDDPLAELARIVGFEPRVAANTVSETPRQEPAFDLEDELLREFERYESPRPLAALDRPADPAPEEAVSNDEPSYEVAPVEADVEAAVDAAAVEPAPAATPHWDAREVLAAADWAASQGREAEPISSGARDLIEELELSISAAPAQPSKAPQWSAASIRLPLANFHTARREEPAAAPVEPVAIAEPAAVVDPAPMAIEPAEEFELEASTGFPAELDRHDEALPEHVEPFAEIEVDHTAFDLVAAAKDGVVPSDAALTEAVAVEASDAAVFDLDALLADVSRYSMPQRSAEPVIADPEPEYASVHEAEPQPEPEEFVAPVQAPAPAAVAAKPEQDFDDPFAGHDFELDLEGIELELADLDFAEPAKAQQIEAPRPQPTAAVSAPVVRPAPVAAAPMAVAPAFVQPSSSFSDAGEDLPFDPSMISDAEYHPEAVEEMHIPALPPVEQPQPVVAASDFDFDVDAEIANLLAPAKPQEPIAKAATQEWHAPAASSASVAKPVIRQSQNQSFDEFERALEEDFRRSASEPVQRKENLSQVRIESASQTEDRNLARSMKRLLAAAAMIVVFGGMAYGGYSFMSRGGSLGISSGEPRVITADKDPVKVVPENPGGKTVPNQDKAVYDSVGGAAAEAPKQKALVSSDEEPVDVVQRTLTPETSPEDNDSDTGDQVAMGTPVGDTEDPRLLPNQQDTADGSVDKASDADKPAVSPRKVRTMIVKPDGTLVAREEPAPAQDSAPLDMPKATPVQTQKILPGAAPANGSAASFPATTEVASADIRATPVEETPAPPQQPSQSPLAAAAAATPADVDPPLRSVKSTNISDTAPVPTARPTNQPVSVVNTVTEKGNVRPPTQPQPKPAEVAAVEPAATKPLQPAAAKTQPVAATGGYGMQIASLPSEDEAKKSYASLSGKFAGVLSGRSYEIRKADIAGKGTFYRVRIPAGSKDEAAALCEKYRTAGGSCLISK